LGLCPLISSFVLCANSNCFTLLLWKRFNISKMFPESLGQSCQHLDLRKPCFNGIHIECGFYSGSLYLPCSWWWNTPLYNAFIKIHPDKLPKLISFLTLFWVNVLLSHCSMCFLLPLSMSEIGHVHYSSSLRLTFLRTFCVAWCPLPELLFPHSLVSAISCALSYLGPEIHKKCEGSLDLRLHTFKSPICHCFYWFWMGSHCMATSHDVFFHVSS